MNKPDKPFGPIDQPINTTVNATQPRPRRRRNSRRNSRVRDFVIGGATTAVATSILPMLLNSGPLLFTILAGCFFVFRGCISNWSRPVQPLAPPVVYSSPQPPVNVQSPVAPLRPRPASHSQPHPRPEPVQSEPLLAEQLPDEQPLAEFLAEAPAGQPFGFRPFPPMPQQPFGVGMFGNMEGQGVSQPSLFFPSFHGQNQLMGALAAPPTSDQLATLESSPLFSFQRGRKFLGTSQMPGEPSRRISLSIDAIREGGRNITAKLSTLDSPRVTKPFSGLIEQNPLRLTLKPVRHPTSFGIVLPHEPWHSNSMAVITLNIASDGKSLTGTSNAAEEFQLLPQFDISETSQARNGAETRSNILAFDENDEHSTSWKIAKRNYKVIEGNANQLWIFTRTNEDGGDFVWTRGDTTLCSGTYVEKSNESSLDIVLLAGRSRKTYCCRFTSGAKTARVCVPKEANDNRPSQVSTQFGNVFDLARIESERH